MTGSLLDVCLALVLIGGAATTLAGVGTTPEAAATAGDSAGGTATSLATTTAAVEYTLATEPAEASPEAERVGHATLAEHLARAAVRSATLGGRTLSPAAADYRRAVRATVAEAIGPRTEVRADWRPLPGTDLGGAIRVGAAPPADAPVRAARISVPAPGPTAAAEPGAASSAARAAVAALFPPDRIAASARDDAPASDLVVERYRRAGAALDVDAVDAFHRDGPRGANRLLADALADRAAGGTADRTATGHGRERAGTVVIVVRTWSA
ncbi:DUF7284 family protein [Halobaculum sp. EA56]|uniref:DUF7284 family protein n=1 Tax=Halobaculum sp. EA56 TaxID=3421648 RepID=UPI003EBE8F9E